jgi:hypothetical protein
MRDDCIKRRKTIVYIVVDEQDVERRVQIATPKAKLSKKALDDTLGFILETSRFERKLVDNDWNAVWEFILNDVESHDIYRFNIDSDKHLEITTTKSKDIIKR